MCDIQPPRFSFIAETLMTRDHNVWTGLNTLKSKQGTRQRKWVRGSVERYYTVMVDLVQ